MEITFVSKKVQKSINSSKELSKQYPPKIAGTIQLRMSQLAAAENLSQISQLPPTRLHKLTANRKFQFAVDAKEKVRIVFYLIDENDEIIEDPDVPKEQVRKIRIIEVVDYHG